jgi:hypothetical protein
MLDVLVALQQGAPELAKQIAPHVYVTVQPAPVGFPEWAKIMISASVGALFGIGSNVAMEFTKPSISKRQLKRRMATHLAAEVMDDLGNVEACLRMFGDIDSARQMRIATEFAKARFGDKFGEKYDHFFEKEWIATQELDRRRALRGFYAELRAVQK